MEEKSQDVFDPEGLLTALEESIKIGDSQQALLASLFALYEEESVALKIILQKLKMISEAGAGKSLEAEELRLAMRASRKKKDDVKSWMKLELKELKKNNPASPLNKILQNYLSFFDKND